MTELPPVADLVPHETPMLAIEELLEWAPGRARVRLSIHQDGLFVRNDRVDTLVTLEYMAQGVAACLGQEAYLGGEGVRVGMVVACREMTIDRPFVLVGEELVIDVERERGSDHASHFRTEVRDGSGARVARALMTLVHPDVHPTRT